ncbi:succinate dehydrogenase/fumarate reductase flavoprotein subunit [Hoeflea halophila]|uniref:Succinate dehydrogenase/fumarate reductase flavoprotein subunit n=1 Tax=Hoeflea halophila TaxID=714899 RepID=A0A286I929_9HYPH|nr:FAD-dependent oxidoreductase [Hoeflea halophila]SOE16600.1 succinate dehydrogenase/fumarate reductase flavoprotein subunit [Hoeflea halophila]
MSAAATPAKSYDLIVVGSGAAGMAAALTARIGGLDVAIFEKDDLIGGSTAVSGGAIWIPNNPLMRAAGMEDDADAAFEYLSGEVGNLIDVDLVKAFIESGPEMVDFFQQNTELKFEYRAFSPDYHPDRPGAAMGGRVLDAITFDGRKLGKAFSRLKPPIADFTLFGGMMLNRFDIGHFMNMTRKPASAWHAAKLLARHGRDRISHSRGTRLTLGQAVAGRLALSALKRGIPVFTGMALERLVMDGDRVTGIESRDGEQILARRGVVLATGGFPANAELRKDVMPHVARGAAHYSMSPKPATGRAIMAAQEIGAHFITTNRNAAFWAPVSLIPEADGGSRPFPHLFLDRAKPGVIAVSPQGKRFVNEAASYHDFVSGMTDAGLAEAWLICDHRALRRYGLGPVRPDPAPYRHHLTSGYLKKAGTPAALAALIGVPEQALAVTIERFNSDAARGQDHEFGKGSTAYQTYLGDAENQPNPCLRPLENAPYYAVRIYPGDIGTSMGLSVDRHARVLREDRSVIPGLYACGNDMNSIMAGTYPGAGITLGPALTFGYIAGRHVSNGKDEGHG